MCVSVAASIVLLLWFFFLNDTATTEIYTLSLHDALPISPAAATHVLDASAILALLLAEPGGERSESTRLNSSHTVISYAVFCLKKKKKIKINFLNIKKKKKKKKTNKNK